MPSLWSASSSPSTRSLPPGAGFSLELIDERPALLLFRVCGAAAAEAFRHEAGGHRWQRVPPNERRGRVHTSTITVAVLREPEARELALRESDLDWKTTTGSGPGGQHRNKSETAVVLTHLPTGLSVRWENGRSQHQNRERALGLLRARLLHREEEARHSAQNLSRREQLGSGMRGDKRRTIRTQEGVVTDHPTGRRWALRDYLRGDFPFRD
jgi:peptide chain release factor 1